MLYLRVAFVAFSAVMTLWGLVRVRRILRDARALQEAELASVRALQRESIVYISGPPDHPEWN